MTTFFLSVSPEIFNFYFILIYFVNIEHYIYVKGTTNSTNFLTHNFNLSLIDLQSRRKCKEALGSRICATTTQEHRILERKGIAFVRKYTDIFVCIWTFHLRLLCFRYHRITYESVSSLLDKKYIFKITNY